MEKVLEIVRIEQVVNQVEFEEASIIRDPNSACDIARKMIGNDDREIFLVMCLNTKNRVIAVHRASVGTINSALVHKREVFKSAFLNNACSIIVAHNHPSGDATPSTEDIEMTKHLASAGQILGVEVLDSLIIGRNREYVSLKEKGYF